MLHREQTCKNATLVLKIYTGGYRCSLGAQTVSRKTAIYFTAYTLSRGERYPQLHKDSLSSSVPLLQAREHYTHERMRVTQLRELHSVESLHTDI